MVKDESAKKQQKVRRMAFLVMSFSLIMTADSALTLSALSEPAEPQRRVSTSAPKKTAGATRKNPRVDYLRFSHQTHAAKEKLSCDSCHRFPTKNWKEVRKGDTAFPDVAEFPEHASCLNCHRQQFFARERPAPAICSNCHVKVTPRDTARFLFPSLGDVSDPLKPRPDVVTEFGINFPHDKHIDVVGAAGPAANPNRAGFLAVVWQQKSAPAEASEPKSCPVCHQTYQPQGKSDDEYVTKPPKDLGDNFWLKKGAFKTIPNSHAICFTCHNADLGIAPAPSECAICHKLGTASILDQTGSPLAAVLKPDFDLKLPETIAVSDRTILKTWRQRISSGAFRHEGGEHPNLSCLKCHNVPALNTVDKKTLIVPVRSCGGAEGCHVTPTTDDGGILNYEIDQKKAKPGFVCTKCHIAFGKEVVPPSHVAAISMATK